jgi:AraC-like DNA-binding protein
LTLYPIEKIPHLFVEAYLMELQEARLLMLNEKLDAASAAHRVGYNNAAHFNRKYKSVFGVPPMRDIQRLREAYTSL